MAYLMCICVGWTYMWNMCTSEMYK